MKGESQRVKKSVDKVGLVRANSMKRQAAQEFHLWRAKPQGCAAGELVFFCEFGFRRLGGELKRIFLAGIRENPDHFFSYSSAHKNRDVNAFHCCGSVDSLFLSRRDSNTQEFRSNYSQILVLPHQASLPKNSSGIPLDIVWYIRTTLEQHGNALEKRIEECISNKAKAILLPRTKCVLTASLRTHLTDQEKELLQARANKCNTTLSEWSRRRLLEAAHLSSDTLGLLQRACDLVTRRERTALSE
jgi:hypothetical protein